MSPRFSIRPLATLADRRLAELAASGDERAFEALIGRHRVELERYCWRLGLPDHHAEDVLQQAFTRAWVALRRGSDVGQPRAWLYRIVHNTAVNAHRSARLRTHESIDAAVEGSLALAPAAEPEAHLMAMEALRHVAELPQMQRRAVVMTALEGRSHEEAAGELGVTDGAVRGLLHRARTKLRAAAAALTPQGLLELLGRSSSGGALSGPPLEVGAGVAGAGIAGVVAKGAAVTVIAGLLAGGAASQLGHHHRHAPPRAAAAADPARATAVAAQARGAGLPDSHAGRSGHEDGLARRGGGKDGRRGREGSASREHGSSGRGGGAAEQPGSGGEDRGTLGRDRGSGTGSGGGERSALTVEARDGTSDASGGGSRSGRAGESTAPSGSGQQSASDGSLSVSGADTTSRNEEPTFAPASSSGPAASAESGGQTSGSGGSGGSGPSGSLDGSGRDR